MTDLPDLKGRLTLPRLLEFGAETVLVRRETMPWTDLDARGPALHSEVRDYISRIGTPETGPPFFRYDLIDMAGNMGMAFGFPVPRGTRGEGDILAQTHPAGRYISVVHNGHPDELYDATVMLIEWAKVRGIRWDMEETPEGDRFAARMEFYRSPDGVPKDDWETEIRIRVAD